MKFNPDCRYIVGVTVDADTSTYDDELLQGVFLAFMHTATPGEFFYEDLATMIQNFDKDMAAA